MTSIKRRAIRDDQKGERRQVLIDQAWGLFQSQPYEAISIIDVAQRAGLAKGTVYLYFRTKEALFLAVLIHQFSLWFDRVDAALTSADSPASGQIAQVVAVLTDALMHSPALVRLFAIVHVVLERNIDYADALHFKQFLLGRVTGTGALLEDHLDYLAQGEGAQVLMRAYALVIGVQHMADPAPVVREVLHTEAELSPFLIDFQQEFSTLLTALLEGLRLHRHSTTDHL